MSGLRAWLPLVLPACWVRSSSGSLDVVYDDGDADVRLVMAGNFGAVLKKMRPLVATSRFMNYG